MAIVQSVGSLQAVNRLAAPPLAASRWAAGSLAPWDHDPSGYAQMYRTQPNVRVCVDFLARNVAQLGLHVFRRESDTDRTRLTDHQLARWLEHPTPYVTRYRLIESVMQDLGVYFNAFWLKVREGDRLGLQRLPPEQMAVAGGLVPSFYQWTTARGDVYEFPVSEVVHFAGYDPLNPLMGLSPLETLRRLIAEDLAAMQHRESFWLNAARIEGVIERPLAAKLLNPSQIEDYRAQWHAKFGGSAGTGAVPILQEGMQFKSMAFSPRQAEYVAARKLSREEVAAAYHIPLPMVGILEHATFSNIREQHKQLYQDALGPWLEMLVGEIERQLLPECRDTDRVYVEFNIAEKLKGSFEEQAESLRTLVGAPVMTRNEARARLNLPSMPERGADALILPLNVTTDLEEEEAAAPPPVPRGPAAPDADQVAIAPIIERAWARQAAALAKLEPAQRAEGFDAERWSRELVADLEPLYRTAGFDEFSARRRAAQLARIVNTDTRMLLTSGIAAFSAREASAYVP